MVGYPTIQAATRLNGSAFDPDWIGLDRLSARLPAVCAAAAGETTDHADGHVVVARDLATEASPFHFPGSQAVMFRLGHASGFARDEFDATGGTLGVPAARMQLVLSSIFSQCQDQTLSLRNSKLTNTFYGQYGHPVDSWFAGFANDLSA